MRRDIRIGLGYTNDPNAFQAGRTVGAQALAEGRIQQPDLALAFASGSLDANLFLQGVQSVLPTPTPILGGSAIGVLTRDTLSYDGTAAGLAVLQWDGLCLGTSWSGDLDSGERSAARRMAGGLPASLDRKLLLVFYDSVRTSPSASTPPIMNASPPLLSGLEEVLGPGLLTVGAGTLADYGFGPTWQFGGGVARQQSVVGALLGGPMEPFVQVMHGCVPLDGVYHRITEMDGAIIRALDGRPVVPLIDDLYGSQDWRRQQPVKRLALGVNHGDRLGPWVEDQCVNRLIAGALPDGQGILLFEPDLEQGVEVLFMLRDGLTMVQSARQHAEQIRARITAARRVPRWGLYIDCAGRTARHSETLTEEAGEVQEVFRSWNVPLLGFYSGVEIAPLLGRSRGLDWSGVLLVLTDG